MSRILVVAQPEFGHILPLLPIMARLKNKGHEIVFVATKQTSWVIERAGFKVEYWSQNDSPDTESAQQSGYSFWFEFTQHGHIPMREAVNERILEIVRQYDPQYFIFDSLFPLSYRVDCAQAPYYGRVALVGIILPRWNVSMLRMASPLLYLCPACFEVPKYVIRHPMVHYVEPSCSQPYDSEETALCGDRPLVLTAFGTQSSLQRSFMERVAVINAVAKKRPNVAFLIGLGEKQMQILQQQKMEYAENVSLRTKIPQRAILERAAAFITHGGLSSIKEAVMQGVPMIITPEVFDQPFNAMRAEYHGLARSIFPEEMNEDVLGGHLDDILGKSAPSNAIQSLQDAFLQADANPVGAMIIEEHLARFS